MKVINKSQVLVNDGNINVGDLKFVMSDCVITVRDIFNPNVKTLLLNTTSKNVVPLHSSMQMKKRTGIVVIVNFIWRKYRDFNKVVVIISEHEEKYLVRKLKDEGDDFHNVYLLVTQGVM